MKIVMVVPNLRLGGLETMMLHLCRGLKAQGHDPIVFAFDCSSGSDAVGASVDGSLLPNFQEAGIRLELFEKGPGFSIAVVRRLARLLKQESADVIHSHDIGSLIYSTLARVVSRVRCKHIHTQHTLVHFKETGRNLKNKIYDFCFSRRVHHLVAVSAAIEQHYLSIGSRRVSRIDNGVAFAETPVLTVDEIEALRSNLISSINDPKVKEKLLSLRSLTWLVNVGRVQVKKGQQDIVDIWNQTSDGFRSMHALIFVGPEAAPEEMARLQAAIGRSVSSQNIICIGPTLKPLSWMLASDLFISASHHEGMPLAPLEAAGSGRPAVLSDIPGHRFLASFASLFALNSAPGTARVLEAKANEVQAQGEAGRARLWEERSGLRSRYGVEQMTEAYLHLYKRGEG